MGVLSKTVNIDLRMTDADNCRSLPKDIWEKGLYWGTNKNPETVV
jgi:hypothetical protein